MQCRNLMKVNMRNLIKKKYKFSTIERAKQRLTLNYYKNYMKDGYLSKVFDQRC